MKTPQKNTVTAEVVINTSIDTVWACWTEPEHIAKWNNPSDEWHNIKIENDLQAGGKFLFAMALKDGSHNFNFKGTYDEVIINGLIAYTLDDGRKTTVTFKVNMSAVKITETFEPENTLPINLQEEFCQAVLDRFKNYVESNSWSKK